MRRFNFKNLRSLFRADVNIPSTSSPTPAAAATAASTTVKLSKPVKSSTVSSVVGDAVANKQFTSTASPTPGPAPAAAVSTTVKSRKPVKPSNAATVSSVVGDAFANKQFSSAETPPSTSGKKKKTRRKKVKSSMRKQPPVEKVDHQGTAVGDFISHTINEGDSAKQISQDISSILCGSQELELDESSDSDVADDNDSVDADSNLPWFSNLFNNSTPLRRKELSRDRKNKWIFKNTQKLRFDKLVSMCLAKLGSGSMFQVLNKLGRGTGLKEYNAFIRGCLETARNSKDEKVQIEQILEAYRLLQLMKERGFPIEEEIFGPFLIYLIDNHMDEQFQLLLEIVKEEDVSLHPRLGYYEMLFWIEMNNEEKIQELCNHIATSETEMGSLLHENYLLALCERDRKELPQILDIIDITRVSSVDNIAIIFRSLGRLSLESFAELFIVVLKDCDYGSRSISDLIYSYASSLKNLAVEDAIVKFREMHVKLDLALVAGSYEKLITFCCHSLKTHLALDLVDEMCEAGLTLSANTLNAICHACEDSSEFILVRRIWSMLHHRKLKPDCETYRSIINLSVRMKDFENAYAMLKDLDRVNLKPSASMYNAILGGYYREKNMDGVLRVLKEMKQADVKPDSHTFSFLITNCTCEEDIVKVVSLAALSSEMLIASSALNFHTSSDILSDASIIKN